MVSGTKPRRAAGQGARSDRRERAREGYPPKDRNHAAGSAVWSGRDPPNTIPWSGTSVSIIGTIGICITNPDTARTIAITTTIPGTGTGTGTGTGITGIVVATIAVIIVGNFGITFSASVERGNTVKAEEG